LFFGEVVFLFVLERTGADFEISIVLDVFTSVGSVLDHVEPDALLCLYSALVLAKLTERELGKVFA